MIEKPNSAMEGAVIDDFLIIGLDFGTTFSGIAYAFTAADKHEVHSILEWPGLEGREQPKVNTLISYGQGSSFEWGAQAVDKDPIVGMKLLLDTDQERPLFIPGGNGRAELKKIGKSAEEIAADYIGALYKHANSRIEAKHPAAYLKRCHRKYVVTVPAVWSDKAKDSTLRAAKRAGIHPVSLITEPEAAALYTIQKLGRSLEVGDAIVVCDAGGGTVDLISYEITQAAPRLELKELVPSKGGMAGSLVLNKRFEAEVQNFLGDDIFFDLKKKKAWKQALQSFDQQVKPAFRGEADEEHLVNFPRANLPNDLENNLEDNCLVMDNRLLSTIFAPVVSEIKKLVDEQVSQIRVKRLKSQHPKADKVRAVFLVGGFGSSEYLKKRLKEGLPDIEVIQPNGAWSAIVNGAVLSALPNEAVVTSSVATRHYGVSARAPYSSLDDEGQPKYWDTSEGIWRCSKMMWYIQTGDDLSRSEKITFAFVRALPADHAGTDLVFEDKIIVSDAPVAPNYPGEQTRTHVTTVSDFRNADRSAFRSVMGADGKPYVKIDFELTLTPMSGLFKFASEINGTEYGTVEAKYT